MDQFKGFDGRELEFFLPDTPERFDSQSFKGSTLIFPVVSIGNVPQLVVDLLIFGCLKDDRVGLGPIQRVGTLDPVDHIPVVSLRDKRFHIHSQKDRQIEHQDGLISDPIEVYQTSDRLYTIVQQRSPVIRALKESHIEKLKRWIICSRFSSILLLVSVDSATRSDAQLVEGSSSPFYHLNLENHPQSLSDDSTQIRKNLINRLDPLVGPTRGKSLNNGGCEKRGQVVPVLSAGGLSRRILINFKNHNQNLSLNDHQGLPEVNSLVMYACEGDNRSDSIRFLKELLKILKSSSESNSESRSDHS
ncbi:hypothetical protein BY996DRAFT_4592122 [Phakopsora pachyrhizi]|nr:hypothetical protein BY996DRAFT_4592122 [Phakopsora pachyrhizi]